MAAGTRTAYLREVRSLVVKVGTRVVLRGERVDDECLAAVAGEMSELRRAGRDVLLVTSGAVGLGLTALGSPGHVDDVSKKQAAAAVGQSLLMQHYRELFGRYGQTVAQILLTQGDIADRVRYLHIRNTLLALLEAGVIPIVNENDTVSVAGVTFGENDKLAALVASKIGADLLVFLSSADGLYTADPTDDPTAQMIPTVAPGDVSAAQHASGAPDATSRGGMLAKVQAARTAASVGIAAVIAGGREERVLTRVLAGEEIGTFFVPRPRVSSRKSWIASALTPEGVIVVDEGAKRALLAANGASLLPSGIVDVAGEFEAGDSVRIVDTEGTEIARGLSRFAAHEVEMIKGLHTSRIRGVLNREAPQEVVHRDDLVVSGG